MSTRPLVLSKPPRDLAWRLVQAVAIFTLLLAIVMAAMFVVTLIVSRRWYRASTQYKLETVYIRGLLALGFPLFIAAVACLRRKNWGRQVLLLCAAAMLVGAVAWIGISVPMEYRDYAIWGDNRQPPIYWLIHAVFPRFLNTAIYPAMILAMLRWPELKRCFQEAPCPAGFELIPLTQPAALSAVAPAAAVTVADPPDDLPAKIVRWVAIFGLVVAGLTLARPLYYTIGPSLRDHTVETRILRNPTLLATIALPTGLLIGSWQCLRRNPAGRYLLLAWSALWLIWLVFRTATSLRSPWSISDELSPQWQRILFAIAIFWILMLREVRNAFRAPLAGFEPILKDQT